MSRHEFLGKAGATMVAIGWDRPLETFYVQVFHCDPEQDGEEVSFIWEGCGVGEIPAAAAAIRIADPYADLPAALGAKLEADRLRTIATRDGPAQQVIKPLIGNTRSSRAKPIRP